METTTATHAAAPSIDLPPPAGPLAEIPKPGALATRQNAIVVGLEEFNPAIDMIIPDLRIGQGTTRTEGAKAALGKFFSSLDVTETYEKVRCVFLKMRHGRVMFPRKENGKPDFDADVPCRSDDGYIPSKAIATPVAPACRSKHGDALCPNASWGKGNEPPRCTETYSMLLVNLDTGIPARLSLKSGDAKNCKKFLSNVMLQAHATKRALFDFEVTLGLYNEKNEDGDWFAITFSDLKKVEPGKHKELFDIYAPRAAAQEDLEAAKAAAKEEADKAAGVPATGTVADAAAKSATTTPPAAAKDEKKSKNAKLDFK